MKRIISKIGVLLATLIIGALPVLAEQPDMQNAINRNRQEMQEQCSLVAKNCSGIESAEHRINRLQQEIRKGTDVYTTDELKNLNDQLREELQSYEGGA